MASGQTTCRHLFEGQHVADLMGVGYSFSTLQQRTMNTLRRSGGWFGITTVLAGLMLLAALVAIFKLLFTSRIWPTTNQPHVARSQEPYGSSPAVPAPTTPISNSKTYTNQQLGFSFGYPGDWDVMPMDRHVSQAAWEVLVLTPQAYKQTEQTPIALFYYDNPNSLPLAELELKLRGNSEIGPDLYSPNNKLVTTLNGTRAYYNKEYLCEPMLCQTYIIMYKNKVLQLINYPRGVTSQDEVFSQVFLSLKVSQ